MRDTYRSTHRCTIFFLVLILRGSKSIDTLVVTSIPTTQLLVSKYQTPPKGTRALGEMTSFRGGSGKVQDEPEVHVNIRMTVTEFSFSSVAQSCPTLCYPTNRSTPGLPVHHQLPEFTQTHVRGVSDAIQPSHLSVTEYSSPNKTTVCESTII